MLLHGYTTDANIPGTEKLVVSALHPDVGMKPAFSFECHELSPDYASLLPVYGVFMVKGWSRTISAFTILLAGFQRPEFWKVGLGVLVV